MNCRVEDSLRQSSPHSLLGKFLCLHLSHTQLSVQVPEGGGGGKAQRDPSTLSAKRLITLQECQDIQMPLIEQ